MWPIWSVLLVDVLETESPDAPGLIVLGANWELESSTPGVERWLAQNLTARRAIR